MLEVAGYLAKKGYEDLEGAHWLGKLSLNIKFDEGDFFKKLDALDVFLEWTKDGTCEVVSRIAWWKKEGERLGTEKDEQRQLRKPTSGSTPSKCREGAEEEATRHQRLNPAQLSLTANQVHRVHPVYQFFPAWKPLHQIQKKHHSSHPSPTSTSDTGFLLGGP